MSPDWAAGLTARASTTALSYRADAALAEAGYTRGDHDTELFTVHPWLAWRSTSGAWVSATVGGGAGTVRHRDRDSRHEQWREWAENALTVTAWGAAAGLPVAAAAGGDVSARARVDGWHIEGEAGRGMARDIAVRGTSYTGGLDWRGRGRLRPVLGTALRHHAGDGADGSAFDVRAGLDAREVLHPRLGVRLDSRSASRLTRHCTSKHGAAAREWTAECGLGSNMRYDPGSRAGRTTGSPGVPPQQQRPASPRQLGWKAPP